MLRLGANLSEDGKPAPRVTVPVELVDFELTIHHNIVTGKFDMSGWSANAVVTLGMLEMALGMVKREILKREMAEQIAKESLRLPPGVRFG